MTKPHPDSEKADVLRIAAELAAARQRYALAIVIEATGSTSAHAGDKAVLDAEGAVMAGWVGGGCAESTVAHAVLECLDTGTPQTLAVDLDDEVLGAGMPCGGAMKVYVEPYIPRPRLWILGHGRVAESLSRLGAFMAFDVIVDDTMASPERFPDASEVFTDDAAYEKLTPAAEDFVVVATQHRGDHQSLQRLLGTEVGYIGLVASRKRAGLIRSYLQQAGFDRPALARIRAPAGIEIKARTPEEIALSVLSEIVLFDRSRAAKADAGSDPAKAGEADPTRRKPLSKTITHRPLAVVPGG